jgi:hypothetical protein
VCKHVHTQTAATTKNENKDLIGQWNRRLKYKSTHIRYLPFDKNANIIYWRKKYLQQMQLGTRIREEK